MFLKLFGESLLLSRLSLASSSEWLLTQKLDRDDSCPLSSISNTSVSSPSHIHSAARESEEETQIWSARIAGNAFTFFFYHKDRKPAIQSSCARSDSSPSTAKRRWHNESGLARCNSGRPNTSIIAGSLRTKFVALLYTSKSLHRVHSLCFGQKGAWFYLPLSCSVIPKTRICHLQ